MKEIFKPRRNCWRVERADYMSVLVDYANYYRDLHESISKAKKSIFILGWDIDSRIELLRGGDKRGKNNTLFDLLCAKAQDNPDLQIYLNRWDYALFFMRQREQFWVQKWKKCGLPNIHVCMDAAVPFSACHHQKIAVIDDEVAFWGGMDVAMGRWDRRQHHVRNKHRADPPQIPSIDDREKFNPYHDIQAVVAGPAARALGEWARKRWRRACPHVNPVPLSPVRDTHDVPEAWPTTDGPDFTNMDMVMARTLPAYAGKPQTEEIHRLLQDEIAQAQHFIYIENQYLACEDIARALEKRLLEKPKLRVLAVSCTDPEGFVERVAMWGGRVLFRDILIKAGVGDRVALAYPQCREKGRQAPIHIHSKLMIVDDRLLHIGSANINNRSMGMDTEFDCTLIGQGKEARDKIASIRNDLIREHTGYAHEYIQQVVDDGDVNDLLIAKKDSRQHLRPLNDEQYRHEKLTRIVLKLADPRRPFFVLKRPRMPEFKWRAIAGNKAAYAFLTAVALMAGLSLLWSQTPLAEYTQTEKLTELFQSIRTAPLAVVWVTLIYVAGGLAFFPVTALSAAVILIFGGMKGFAFSMIGAMASGLTGFAIGAAVGKDRLERWFPRTHTLLDRIKDSGVIGVTVLRTLPIMPFSLANMVFGVSRVSLVAFLAGTFLGLAPGKIMLVVFGQSLGNVFDHPSVENVSLTIMGFIAWIAVVMGCNKLARGWQAHREQVTA